MQISTAAISHILPSCSHICDQVTATSHIDLPLS